MLPKGKHLLTCFLFVLLVAPDSAVTDVVIQLFESEDG